MKKSSILETKENFKNELHNLDVFLDTIYNTVGQLNYVSGMLIRLNSLDRYRREYSDTFDVMFSLMVELYEKASADQQEKIFDFVMANNKKCTTEINIPSRNLF
jgi:hypothetical protein